MTNNDKAQSIFLAVDCSTGPCSVALARGGELLAQCEEPKSSAQAKLLVPMMQQALQKAGIGFADISAMLCTTGPGSFTGIRIGLAAVRAAAFARGIAARGVSTLAILAEAAQQEHPRQPRPIGCLMHAGKNQLYAQLFAADGASALTEPCLVDIPALPAFLPEGGALLCGNATADMLTTLPAELFSEARQAQHPQARYAISLALRHPAALGEPSPLYIRPPDAIIPARPITAA